MTANRFSAAFDSYVCTGDTISADVDGFTITATIHHDSDTRPDDFDCYDESTIQAWKDDEWFFCGVALQVSREGVDLTGDYGAALWGVDANYPGSDNAYLTETANDLIEEALEDARATLARLLASAEAV